MGILIGGLIGYRLGGFIGMLLGAWLGHQVTQFISGDRRFTKQNRSAIQHSFFKALFVSMGKLAKLDGVVSRQEIDRAEIIMNKMKLTPELRQQAINYFNLGKQAHYKIERDLTDFRQKSRTSLSLKQFFLEMLIDMATVDGAIDPAEQRLIEQICQLIGYPVAMLHAMFKMRSSGYYQQHSGQSRQRQRSHTRPTSVRDPYRVLGVDKSADKQTIRRAYKKLMSQHHPDKLVSKGLPPEMMKVAEEKAKNIQLAWEEIKDLRGW
ncbi:MAG: co-chaperone DjlA [Marinicella pacifica]